ncbi:MAG: acyl-CoA carboxylase subunit beta [Rhodospirillales bacterium]|nr:acyl-CoA carboxylase subunit beta [Rhodospirillales bacterium]
MGISKDLLDELARRRAEAESGGGRKKTEARRAKGLMTARDRIDALFEAGTFQEFGLHARHDTDHFTIADKAMGGDGVVTGVGYVDGRPASVFSQDFTVAGGSLGKVHAEKVCAIMDYAERAGIPVVGFNDSGGARIQEGIESLSGYGQVFNRNVRLSGVVPQVAVIAGPCAGGAAYSPALMDFVIMLRNDANMFICGPDVIKAATGQSATVQEIGGAESHATASGNIHFVAENDAEAVSVLKRLLSYLPPNNMTDPPHHLSEDVGISEDAAMNAIVPADVKEPFDVKQVIERLSDAGSFLEVQEDFAPNLVVGFARIEGCVVGIVANQPKIKAGTLDIDASDKGARFIRTCNVFNIPLVTLVDVPGFLPGIAQERGGIIRHGAKMLFAYGASTVPKVTVIMRKAYGGAYLAMCSLDMGADAVFAWPTAEIAVMGAEGAVRILYKRELDSTKFPDEMAEELVAEYRQQFASPYHSAGLGYVTDIIEPANTRVRLALSLRTLLSKRETRPPKKHGNIPL